MGFSRFVGIGPSLALGNRRVGRVGRVGRVTFLGLVGLVGLVGLLPQCSSDAVGIDACRKVEEARCRRAKECGLPLATPPAVGDEVEACIRFYKDACLRGLTSKTDPGEPGVLACVDAVRTRECAVVQRPETTPACAFLQPATPDAGPGILDAQPNGSPDGGSDAATTGTGQDASLDGSAVGFGLDAG